MCIALHGDCKLVYKIFVCGCAVVRGGERAKNGRRRAKCDRGPFSLACLLSVLLKHARTSSTDFPLMLQPFISNAIDFSSIAHHHSIHFIQVARLEQAMMVGRRWQPLEAPYQQALSELKQHHIQRLHLLVEKHVNAIRAHASALQRRHSTARNRHDITQLSRTRSKARGSLKAAIQELQYWHRIPLHGPWASSSQSRWSYNAELLDADELCVHGVPWAAQELHVPHTLLNQQLLSRAKEEKAIIQREARDANEFHAYFVDQCARASAEVEEELMHVRSCDFERLLSARFLPGAVHFKYAADSQGRLLEQFLQGKLVMLREKRAWYQARLDDMRGFTAWLQERESGRVVSEPDSGAQGGHGNVVLESVGHLAEDGGMLEELEEAALGGLSSLMGEEVGGSDGDE